MKNFIFDIVKIFIGFLLANLVAIYIKDFFRYRSDKLKYDILLSEKILSFFNQIELNNLTNAVASGYYNRLEFRKLEKLSDANRYNSYYDGKVNKKFSSYIESLDQFYKVQSGLFSTDRNNDEYVAINKHHDQSDSENYEKLRKQARICQNNYEEYLAILRKKYPIIFHSPDKIIVDNENI